MTPAFSLPVAPLCLKALAKRQEPSSDRPGSSLANQLSSLPKWRVFIDARFSFKNSFPPPLVPRRTFFFPSVHTPLWDSKDYSQMCRCFP